MKKLIPLLLSLLLAGCNTVASSEISMADLNKQIDQTNFQVNGHQCSGTLVDKDKRLILTADHCIASQCCVINFKTGGVEYLLGTVGQPVYKDHDYTVTPLRAKVIADDEDGDIAMLQILDPLPNTQSVKLSCKAPLRGDKEYAVGNPKGFFASLSEGIIASVDRSYKSIGMDDDNTKAFLYQITSSIAHGSSGGAVLNAQGNLIGFTDLIENDSVNIADAISLETIVNFLKANKITIPCA